VRQTCGRGTDYDEVTQDSIRELTLLIPTARNHPAYAIMPRKPPR